MRNDASSFPCLEHPIKCFISCDRRDKRLSCCPKGNIFSSKNRKGWEEWHIIESSNGVMFRSCEHKKYLIADSCGHTGTCTIPTQQCLWKLTKQSASISSYLISHGGGKKYLHCRENGDISGLNMLEKYDSDDNVWEIEVLSGELCFISSPLHDKRLSCNVSGELGSSQNWKGWEVWRFIESGSGYVRISNWTHTNTFLCSNGEGHVWTTNNHKGSWELWHIEEGPDESDGLVIKSALHDMFLTMKDSKIMTCKTFNPDALWHTNAGNSANFYLSSVSQNRRIGSSNDSVFTTQNRKGWEVWKLINECNGLVSFYSREFGTILASDPNGKVYITKSINKNCYWKLEELGEKAGICIKSAETSHYLICNSDGNLCAKAHNEKDPNPIGRWALEPCMPHTITRQQIRNRVIGGSIAAASMIAAPFLVMGAVAGLGFGAGGIVSGSVAASMMSAEAVASGGLIAAGGTVATLQSIGAAGLGIVGTSAAVGAGSIVGASAFGISTSIKPSDCDTSDLKNSPSIHTIKNRPFCNWRSW